MVFCYGVFCYICDIITNKTFCYAFCEVHLTTINYSHNHQIIVLTHPPYLPHRPSSRRRYLNFIIKGSTRTIMARLPHIRSKGLSQIYTLKSLKVDVQISSNKIKI
ncbi:hypothetical protein Leryth_010226 [Lithospermum erythrorhizon]|nr:hypothetical protein Leryth_010226 [Lithospermum erythrorhizon]